MTTYNEAGLTYDEIGLLYDGVQLGGGVDLLVSGALVDKHKIRPTSLRVRITDGSFGTQGNIDFTLIAPSLAPVTDAPIVLYSGLQKVYEGLARDVETMAVRGAGITEASVSGMDDSGSPTGLPAAAPFALSDTPNGTTTRKYVSIRRMARTTEELGIERTTYVVVTDNPGILPGMNVEVTSALLGLAAEELSVNEVEIAWRGPLEDVMRYTLQLGAPTVRLHQVMQEIELPDGSIIATKISDGAITTPKLAANAVTAAKIAAGTITADEIAADAITTPKLAAGAVTADEIAANAVVADKIAAGAITTAKLNAAAVIVNVLNAGGNVEIDTTGIAVTGDAGISVTNAGGKVIIDGTSNMFKILTTGTFQTGSIAGNGATDVVNVTESGLGTFSAIPGFLAFVDDENANAGGRYLGRQIEVFDPSWAAATSGGAVTNDILGIADMAQISALLNGSSQVIVRLFAFNRSNTTKQFFSRYHVLKEAAI